MFLEYWMITLLIAVFAAGLYHMYRSGYHEGVEVGAEATIDMLEHEQIIDVLENGEVVAKRPRPIRRARQNKSKIN